MSLTSEELTDVGFGAGKTRNFHVQYETSLPNQANIRANCNGLLAVLEGEFKVTTEWFATPAGPFGSEDRQVVNFNKADGSGANNSGYGSAINQDPQGSNGSPTDAANRVRMLFMNEWVEILMSLTDGRWTAGNSSGEGLSQYAGIIRFPAGHYSYYGSWVDGWLNTRPRPDWVTHTDGTDRNATSFGCALAFLFYLNSQLGFTIEQIIAAGDETLAKTYHRLTGHTDAWQSFITLVNKHYPPDATQDYSPTGDDIFPVAELSSLLSPGRITAGYSGSARLVLDKPAPANVVAHLVSDNPNVVAVAPTATVPLGSQTPPFVVGTGPRPGPFPIQSVNVHATYAGVTKTMAVEVGPPTLQRLMLSPTTVTAGATVTATVTLNRPSLDGPVTVDLLSDAPGFATVPSPPQLVIPEGAMSGTFTVTSLDPGRAFATAHADIMASYSGSFVSAQLTIQPSVEAGTLHSLTVLPTTVVGGSVAHGAVTLDRAVSSDTVVSLAALDTDGGPHLPTPGGDTALITVPASVTVHVGSTSAGFSIHTERITVPGTRRATVMAVAVATKFATLTVTSG